ncbi:phage tail tape measure protein [Sesbania bispinosa]|nr:phage tail tape measure protein [Sesbania bispinosa]
MEVLAKGSSSSPSSKNSPVFAHASSPSSTPPKESPTDSPSIPLEEKNETKKLFILFFMPEIRKDCVTNWSGNHLRILSILGALNFWIFHLLASSK